MKRYCGVDLGGTNIAAGIVDEEYQILTTASAPTPKGVDGVTLAAAIAQSQNAPDGPFVRTYIQPAGAVEAAVLRRDGEEASAWIGGPVILDPLCEIEI